EEYRTNLAYYSFGMEVQYASMVHAEQCRVKVYSALHCTHRYTDSLPLHGHEYSKIHAATIRRQFSICAAHDDKPGHSHRHVASHNVVDGKHIFVHGSSSRDYNLLCRHGYHGVPISNNRVHITCCVHVRRDYIDAAS